MLHKIDTSSLANSRLLAKDFQPFQNTCTMNLWRSNLEGPRQLLQQIAAPF